MNKEKTSKEKTITVKLTFAEANALSSVAFMGLSVWDDMGEDMAEEAQQAVNAQTKLESAILEAFPRTK